MGGSPSLPASLFEAAAEGNVKAVQLMLKEKPGDLNRIHQVGAPGVHGTLSNVLCV
jgi:hypothetical protein